MTQQSKTETKRRGPGWVFTISLAIAAYAAGAFSSFLTDAALLSLGDYAPPEAPSTPALLEETAFNAMPLDTETDAKEFFPPNNQIDWSISLRRGYPTIPVGITNESERNNQRVLFQIVSDKREPQLAAVLHIEPGNKAEIRLPAARYRLDLISTPIDMPWEIAQKQLAIPARNLDLTAAPNNLTVKPNLLASDQGIRPEHMVLRRKPVTAEEPEEPSKKGEDQLLDYGDLGPTPTANDEATDEAEDETEIEPSLL